MIIAKRYRLAYNGFIAIVKHLGRSHANMFDMRITGMIVEETTILPALARAVHDMPQSFLR